MKQPFLHVDVAAKTLDAAVEKALAQLSCTRADADIEVLQVQSTGFFGLFGARLAQVRLKLRDRGHIARHFTSRLLRLSQLDADVELVASGQKIELNLKTQDPGRLVGLHGQTLDALQTLVGIITDRLTTDRTPIQLDVDGYRARRLIFLNRLAHRLSHKVRQSGMPAATPPLILSERRILHDLFKHELDLESHSKHYENGRKTIILQTRVS